ncbi:MAG: hypothetical protein UT86_C0001G0161 [Candidatus Magasanikbacteria bacterium GW2011_GWC2_40_17]|uniref:Uncharacterized protein n=1 Tax=Candidatus Magasanikbacteria bacterium GW2011_GWA2_42_32 TaxID=1619039 RepID=A0A0G1CG29_9BACT|nr:MAG: hypothetical protein UT86_C0001G0161 [Candidatus Magasanikbacteria bacterium GW2011_GWC2_40_17]KKS57521.1 MAG: hypothetical protein UV20_C0001G0161 [Candidatus Magasanikbacteria bacterium GW2011_GWA2_42_32]OGH85236.1 MAG: hypothetical protein A2294_00630 [Candidatus Magasanikbacteria bacterium RIFOXYB2_FULL_38_10]
MFWRFLLSFLIIFLAFILQIGLIVFLPTPFSFINIVFIILILNSFFNKRSSTNFFLILSAGLLSEMFAQIFGIFTFCLLTTFILFFWIAEHFVTNKTNIALGLLSIFVFFVFNFLISFFSFLLNLKFGLAINYSFLNHLQTAWTGALVNTPLILIINLFNSKFERLVKSFVIIK